MLFFVLQFKFWEEKRSSKGLGTGLVALFDHFLWKLPLSFPNISKYIFTCVCACLLRHIKTFSFLDLTFFTPGKNFIKKVMKINKMIYSQIYSDRQRKEQWRRTNGLNSCTLRTRYLPFSVTWPLMWHLVVATCLFSLK